jgi:hypothetical protein
MVEGHLAAAGGDPEAQFGDEVESRVDLHPGDPGGMPAALAVPAADLVGQRAHAELVLVRLFPSALVESPEPFGWFGWGR